MATCCFNHAAILAVSVMHSSSRVISRDLAWSRVISRDQQAKIADTQTLGKRDEWPFFVSLFFGRGQPRKPGSL